MAAGKGDHIRMTPTPAIAAPLTGLRKAAVFLMGVGEEVSAELLRQLSPEEGRMITSEISSTPLVGSDQIISVFGEFETLSNEGRLSARGGSACARRLLENAFGPESARKLLVAADPVPEETSSNVLENTDPNQVSLFLKNEHPQTIAV